jgi:ribosomal protein S18 acetylase RimI-like enzyme
MQSNLELSFRLASPPDFGALKTMVIAAFEPITWQKKLDENFGPLNGRNWRDRWTSRLEKICETQIVLLGESSGRLAAMASGTVDQATALGFIDVLAVSGEFQGQGLGRQMLRGMIAHLQGLGCQHVNLDCLADNETANALYQSEGFTEVARHIRWFK